ncbi:ATP synthase protein I [Siminovitchia terrae]|uniref:ATP synthase protein I n=1 Tax=Siminovitchia terrae TaxID=1914933 RepID=A0A429XC02_SIMTE|nr:ATP synthase subunit I [Siminovitchia terrae]RST60987.1 ATP synthase subunit I [Siminovitchia terrae]GIN90848.1 ATP synthase protein I [Siminovitchia terrae]GIN97623.1 ATP synthase protein I [Siminovitchia terrae]
MDNLQQLFNRQRKYILYLLAILVLGWGFTPYQSIFMGLILGTSISFFNLWMMVRRMNKFGEAVLTGRKMRSLGTLSRMAAAILGVFIAMQYPETFNLISVIIGLMTSYLVIAIDALISILFRKDKQREER